MIDCTTYEQLARYVQAFADGHFGLLFIIGPPGTGKTTALKQAMRGRAHLWLDGTISAVGFFCELHDHINLPVILDDVDGLYSDKAAVRLLKALCATERVKRLRWNTASSMLKQRGAPNTFDTTSRVAVIANSWKRLNENVSAVQDRGHMIRFAPTNEEIHRYVCQWFWDQAIADFVWTHLPLVESLSGRDYVTAAQQRQAGLDWRRGLLARWGVKAQCYAVSASGTCVGHVWARSEEEGQLLTQRLKLTTRSEAS